jgi:hypothetical protein
MAKTEKKHASFLFLFCIFHYIMIWLAVVIVAIIVCLVVAFYVLRWLEMSRRSQRGIDQQRKANAARIIRSSTSRGPIFINSVTLYMSGPYMLAGTQIEVYAGAQKLPVKYTKGMALVDFIPALRVDFEPAAVTQIRVIKMPSSPQGYISAAMAGEEVAWFRVSGEQVFTVV